MKNRILKNKWVVLTATLLMLFSVAGPAHAQTTPGNGSILGGSAYQAPGSTGSGGDSILTNSTPTDTSLSPTSGSLLNPSASNSSLLGGTSGTLGTPGSTDATAAATTQTAAPAAAAAPAAGASSSGAAGCSWSSFSISDCLLNGIALFIFGLANTLLALAGVVLNLVVLRTIFQFSSLIGNSPGLLIGWGLLRDISNMLLLFGFVYIGISTILGLSTYTVKKTLPRLLIFAVLLNFSLFAAEAIIDTSNLFSSVMYSQANTSTCQSTTSASASTNTDANCAVNYGIAGHIMQSTGLSSVFASNAAGSGTQEGATLVGLSIFAVIGTVVIIAMAIMFAIRAIVLTFLMVTAPIGFAGMAIPQLNRLATRWWDALIKQSFFAPVMLILVFISLKVTDSFGRNGSLGAALGNSNVDTISVIFIFVIVCGFLLASLKIASDMGAVGSKMAIGFATKNTGRLTLGAGAFIARRTAGPLSAAAADGIKKSTFFRKNPYLGRTALALANKGATSSYDVRATKTFGTAVKSVGSQAGVNLDFGKPGKTAAKGYNAILDEAKKRRDAFAKEIKPDAKLQKQIDEENTKINNAKNNIKNRNKDTPIQIAAEKEQNAKNLKDIEEATKPERDAIKAQILVAKSDLEKTKTDIIAARTNNESFERKIELDKLFDDQQKAIDDLNKTDVEKAEALSKALNDENTRSKNLISSLNAAKDRDNRADNAIVSSSEERLNNDKTGLAKQAKLEHAEALEKSGVPFPFVSKKANKLAADALRKEVNKSKDQREKDDLVEGLKKAAKGDEKPKEDKEDKGDKPDGK